MAIFRCSMFGHIVYDDKLTYQELLDTEARVTALMQNALEECGAQHIDFAPEADALLMECLFSDMDRAAHRVLCDTVIRQLGPGVLARFLFVDRRMDDIAFYFLGRGKWQEQAFSVPTPREALSGRVVRQERNPILPLHPQGLVACGETMNAATESVPKALPPQDGEKSPPEVENAVQTTNVPEKRTGRNRGTTGQPGPRRRFYAPASRTPLVKRLRR